METIEVHVEFDQMSQGWHSDKEVSLLFLKHTAAYLNNVMAIRGYVFLNEVYDALGVDRTSLGGVVGWSLDNPLPITINVVDERDTGALILDIPDAEFVLGRLKS